jgi:predicted small lipoprotein YifL
VQQKKVLIAVLSVLVMFTLAACGGKYSDALELSEKQLDAMEDYADSLEKAESKEALIAAMEDFAEKMEKLMPKAEALREKYPELYRGEKLPEEFAQLEKKTEAVVTRMTAASMKTMQYMMDPKVQQAMMRMNSAMMSPKS